MPSPLKVLKDNVPYAYGVVGALWLVVAFVDGSLLLLWPALACLLGGAMVRLRPRKRLTWAWATAAAVMGLLLSLYQVYAAVPLVSSAFSTVAGASLVAFAIFALGHLLLIYVKNTGSLENP